MSEQQPEASTSSSLNSNPTLTPISTSTMNNESKARSRSTRKDKSTKSKTTKPSPASSQPIPKPQKTRTKPVPTPITPFENPAEGEEETVHEIYERIAPHFAQTRHKPWPLITTFLSALPPHSIGLDSGCGNGKYLPTAISHECRMIGMDRSLGLLKAASGQEGGEDLVRGDLGGRGWRDGVFDFAISVAAIHHLSTPERRKQAVQALLPPLLHRSAPPYSRFFIYVWAYEQGEMSKRRMGTAANSNSNVNVDTPPVDSEESCEALESRDAQGEGGERIQDVLVPWVLKSKSKNKTKSVSKSKSKRHPKSESKSKSEPVDIPDQIPSPSTPQNDTPENEKQEDKEQDEEEEEEEEEEKVYHRYYHLFIQGELENLVLEAGKEEGYRIIPRHSPPQYPSVEEIAVGLASASLDADRPQPQSHSQLGTETGNGTENGKWLRIRGIGWEADNWWIEAEVGLGTYISEEEYGLEAA